MLDDGESSQEQETDGEDGESGGLNVFDIQK